MDTAGVRWSQTFPYRGGEVLVVRLERSWRVALGVDRGAEAHSIVDAFEKLTGRHASRHELVVVGTALVIDRGAQIQREYDETVGREIAQKAGALDAEQETRGA